jgi:multisubunit Na+/H+ antiporter MnhF subunit
VLFAIVVIVAGMFMCLYRLLRGPHLADRALAVDVISIQLIGLVILLTIRYGTVWFTDGVMVLSLIGFAGTVAMAQYIARPHVRRSDRPDRAAEGGPLTDIDSL